MVRVFCGKGRGGGNPLGVFIDGRAIAPSKRQTVAADLGFSETVFVDEVERGVIRIFTPAVEIPFAGHPVVGTAWLLGRERDGVPMLRPPTGEVPVRSEGGIAHAAGRPEWAPEIGFLRVGSPAEVESLDGPPPDAQPDIGVWAWIDEPAGVIRERVFAPGYGIAEDDATGSAAISLASRLGRDLDIRQGRGSRILARLLGDGMVEIAGRVELDEVREYELRV